MFWGFVKFFALGLAALAVLLGLLSLFGAWGFAVGALLVLAWLLPVRR